MNIMGFEVSARALLALFAGGVIAAIVIGASQRVEPCKLWATIAESIRIATSGTVDIPCPFAAGG
jgi:hypothetical protein